MKWLNDYVSIASGGSPVTIEDFARAMTMSGSKVEKWTDLSEPLKNIVCGKVVSIEKHADSDRLWIAQVVVGAEETEKRVQIVTGAQNVTAGALVPVALEGGVVFNFHDGSVTTIKRSKIRGAESAGMMCSYNELGLTLDDLPYADADGILILDNDPEADKLKIGMDMLEFFGIRDIAVEFEITNNRPDCLSVTGLAREASAAFNLPFNLKKPEFKGIDDDINLTVRIENIENLENPTELANRAAPRCSRYMAAVVKNAKVGASPRWLAARLRASGVRPINNFVDITNYVMLEYGHPMHAFDKRYVDGDEIIVRNAAENEKIVLLDGEERILDSEILIIADSKKPIAVAGVMGGEYSGIMDDTAEIVFESACFDGLSVRKAARKIGRRTESAARFEKGLNPVNVSAPLIRACELVELLGCGEVVKTIIDVKSPLPEPVRVKYDYKKINSILGSDISEEKQLDILNRLELKQENGFIVVPSFRTDIELECDIAEEVARIYGYNEIASTLPLVSGEITDTEFSEFSKTEAFIRKTRIIMQGQGCHETMTYSFVSRRACEKAGVETADGDVVVIRNPLGEETSIMRASMLPSMLEIIARNYNNRNPEARFYEIGTVFRRVDKAGAVLPLESKVLCIGIYGEKEDFFTLKGLVEELLGRFEIKANFTPLGSDNSYHSGRCAEVSADGEVLGVIGEINPLVSDNFDIGARVYCAEFKIEKLLLYSSPAPKFKALPKFPPMTRDLSLLCDEGIAAGDVAALITANAANLEQLTLFDAYTGSQIPDGKKSLSYKLVFRKADSTLTDEETDKATAEILRALEQKGITLR